MKTDCSCSSCIHAVVCPHQKALSDAQEAVNKVLSDSELGFIKPVSLECKYHSPKIMTRGDVR